MVLVICAVLHNFRQDSGLDVGKRNLFITGAIFNETLRPFSNGKVINTYGDKLGHGRYFLIHLENFVL
jgi:hypothetical protein